MKKLSIVITGGAGFIGHHLVKKSLSEGHQVSVFDNFSTGDINNLIQKDGETGRIELPTNLNVYNVDISDGSFPSVPCDVLVHLAAPVSVQESLENPEKYRMNILEGSRRIFDWARGTGVKSIVVASTAAVYGDNEELPLKESVGPSPMSPYAEYKLKMEELLKSYNSDGLKCTALRFFNVYGEGQRTTGGYLSAIPIFLSQYKRLEPITVTGDGNQTRDFVYVGDVCNAISAAYNQEWKPDMPIYNVGSGKEWKIIDIATALGGEITNIEARKEIRRSLSSIDKIKGEINWLPETNLLRWITSQK